MPELVLVALRKCYHKIIGTSRRLFDRGAFTRKANNLNGYTLGIVYAEGKSADDVATLTASKYNLFILSGKDFEPYTES